MHIKVDSGYLLTPVAHPNILCEQLAEDLQGHDLLGTLIVAPEGLNWSLSGASEALEYFSQSVRTLNLPGIVRSTRTPASSPPFAKLKLRVRAELVTSGVEFAHLSSKSATHLAPEDFNALIKRPETRLIDVRNQYEIELGTFQDAENPSIENFTEFQDYVERTLKDADKSTSIALCCTGGIRCERASQLLINQGFTEVYQLDGGILAYLAQIPAERQAFTGECFVFDGRVSLTRALGTGSYRLNGSEIAFAASAPTPPTPAA